MGKVLAVKILQDLNNINTLKIQKIAPDNNFLNGQIVHERMLEIVNSIAV